MINIDQCEELRPKVRYSDGANLTISDVKSALEEKIREHGINAIVTREQVKSGGIFNSNVDDCLLIYHRDHQKDYFNHLIIMKKQGNFTYLSTYGCGKSKQIGKQARSDFAKDDRKGKSVSYKLGSVVASTIASVGLNKNKVEEENMYYDSINFVIDEVVS